MFEISCRAAFDWSSAIVFSARISPIFHVSSHEYLWDPMSVELSLDNRYNKQQLCGLVIWMIPLVCPFRGLYKKQKGWKCPSVCGFPCFKNWLRLYLVFCQPNQGRNKELFLAERKLHFFLFLVFFQFAHLTVRWLVTLHFNFTLYEQNYRWTYLTWCQNCFLL